VRNWKSKFLKALKEDPEFAAEVRALLLSEDLLNLPPKFDRMEKKIDRIEHKVDKLEERTSRIEERQARSEERQVRLEERQARLEEKQDRLEKKVDKLVEEVAGLKQDVDTLKQDVDTLKQDVDILKKDVDTLKKDVDTLKKDVDILKKDVDTLKKDVDILKKDVAYLKGSDRERWYRDKAHAVFGRLVLKGKPFEEKAVEILWDAYKRGQISKEERDEVLSADLLWSGERDGKFVVLVVEVSFTISQNDIERAKKRAEILRKLGILAIPVVGGVELGKQVKLDDVVCIVDGKFDDEEFEKLFLKLSQSK
jgi:predicted  nucleic acid-binding Zn-ribbon protein